MAVTSIACGSSSAGSSPGSRSASIVLPAPGGPASSRWCPPAAAISSASSASCLARRPRRGRGTGAGGGRARQRHRHLRDARPCSSAAYAGTSSARSPTGCTRDAGDEAGLGRVGDRDHDVRGPRRGRPPGRAAARRGPVAPARRARARRCGRRRARRRAARLARGERQRRRWPRSKPVPTLRDGRRREVDDDAALATASSGVGGRGLDAVGATARRRVAAGRRREDRQARRRRRLDVDDEPVEPPQPDRARAPERHQHTAPHVLEPAGPSARPQDADDVDAEPARPRAMPAWWRRPARRAASRRSRASLRAVTASKGCAEPPARGS